MINMGANIAKSTKYTDENLELSKSKAKMPQLKVVIFDFGGVIMSYRGTNAYWKDLEIERNLPEGSIRKTMLSSEFASISYDLFTGIKSAEEVEENEFIRIYNRQHNLNAKPFPVIRNWLCDDSKLVSYNENVLEAIKILRDSGIKTALLTNTYYIDKQRTKRRMPIDRALFDSVVESCAEGIMKPHPQIFKILLDRLDIRPEECVFVDDHYANCETAKMLGMKTVHVKNSDTESALIDLEDILNEDMLS
uniref:Uncharacterized protein n=1 Tax=Acrobeloides nanus TaxID=290746 RepID=A0A914BVR8_9BILA